MTIQNLRYIIEIARCNSISKAAKSLFMTQSAISAAVKETEDELGNTVYELAPLKTCWAELRPVRGKEQLEYYKSVNDLMYKVTIRRTDVTEKDVILFRGSQFQINYITIPLEDNYYLELMCTESKDHAVKEVDHG